MLDTVRVKIGGLWGTGSIPLGWTRTTNAGEKLCGAVKEEWRCLLYQHKGTDLRIGGDNIHARWFEVSLPRVRFGDNGQLITTPLQLDEAFVAAAHLVRQIVPAFEYQGFDRLDVVWQFPIPPKKFIAAHRDARHPRVRKENVEHKGETLYWKGKKFFIRMYNKDLEVWKKMRNRAKRRGEDAPRKPSGNTTRVEIELKAAAVRDMLGAGIDYDFYDFYGVYRSLCWQFQPLDVPEISTMKDLVAALHREGATVGGIPILDALTVGRHRATRYRWQRVVSSYRPCTFNIDWKKLVPENALPAVCNV